MSIRHLFISLLLASQTATLADQFDDLRLKWKDLIVGVGYNPGDPDVSSRLSTISNTAAGTSSSMDKSPTRTFLWSDLASTTDPSQITSGYGRLRSMALAYATPGCALHANPTLLANTIGGLDWMNANRYGPTTNPYGNWWEWDIGIPLHLTDICVLLYDHLTPAQVSDYMAAIERHTPSPTGTGANLVWTARAVGVRGCLVKSPAKLTLARDAFSSLFPYVTTGDGFYEDGGFIQHNRHPYTAGYGRSLLSNTVPMLRWLDGSSWAVTDPARANLFRWIFDSFEPVIYRGAMWDLVRGRGIVSTSSTSQQDAGHETMEAILQAAVFAPPAEGQRMNAMVKYLAQSDTARDFVRTRGLPGMILAKQIMEDPAIVPRGELTGHYLFPSMDRVVHLRPGFGFGVAMCSDRIYNFSSINGENLRGWFTGDGMTYLYNADLRQYGDGYWATVDHYRLPGVTADPTHGKLPAIPGFKGSIARTSDTLSPHNWVGGAELGDFGAVGMQLKGAEVSLTGKKSWFMFDDEVVCLGAGITSSDGRPIETTIENRRLADSDKQSFTVNGQSKPAAAGWSETIGGTSWAHLAGTTAESDIGYYFPQPGPVTAAREARTGGWLDVRENGSSTPMTRDFLRMTVEHGSNPVNATYQYVILPGRSARRVGHYAAHPQITVLANTGNVQAVRENSLGITAANFWNDSPQTAGGITSNRKSSVLVRDAGGFIEVAVSDPTQSHTGSITVQVATPAGTLISADPQVTVVQSTPILTLQVNVAGARGRSFNARFYPGTLVSADLTPVADAYVHDAPTGVDKNFGDATQLVVKNSSAGLNRESYLRFNVPPHGLLLGATLKLRCLSTTAPGVSGVSRVQDNTWIESGPGGITWNNRPPADPAVLATWTPGTNVQSSGDVGPAINGGGPVSFRVRATTQTSDGIVNYASKEHSTAANRPLLSLTTGQLPPSVTITSPADGAFLGRPGSITLTASVQSTGGGATSVVYYNHDQMLGTVTAAPYSLTVQLPGGEHRLTAVANDANGLTATSQAVHVDVSRPPAAGAGNITIFPNTSIDVDLRTLASDAETPAEELLFTLGQVPVGSAVLLADGHTVRFTPPTGFSGPAGFNYTVTDTTRDERMLFNYPFQDADISDATGLGRDGTVTVQGNGSVSYPNDVPAALAPYYQKSVRLTENGTAGAARLDRIVSGSWTDLKWGDWTIAGWFKRMGTTNQDSLFQLGNSGGYASNALTLAFYSSGSTLDLRNYNGNNEDVLISKTGVAANQWHHFAVARAGGYLSFYLNGTLVGSDNSFSFQFGNTDPVKFGGVTTSVPDRWLNGSMADLVMFSDDLSAADIARLRTAPVRWFGGQNASTFVPIHVLHPPQATPVSIISPAGQTVDIDLGAFVTDGDTPAAALRFVTSGASNGAVTLLADGRTARFTPAPGFTGTAGFGFSVTDTTPDPRVWLNWPMTDGTANDATGNGRHGQIVLRGTGTAALSNSAPTVLAPQHVRSLSLNESDSAGAARLEAATTGHDFRNQDWTISGWFRRTNGVDIDSLLQFGESGGWGNDALSLVLPAGVANIELRNYAGATQDVGITRTGVGSGVWHHFAVVRNAGTISLFVNGTHAGSDSSFQFTFDPATPLKLGGVRTSNDSTTWDRWYLGQLADFAIFNSALGSAEITRITQHPVANLGGLSVSSSATINFLNPIETWRQLHFASSANSGNAADLADPDRDGVTNLMEYASGADPMKAGGAVLATTPAPGGFAVIFSRNKAATDVTRVVEWSNSPAGPQWSTSGVGVPVVTQTIGSIEKVSVFVPDGGAPRRFARLRVTKP